MEVMTGDAVVFAPVTLGLVPEVLDAVDVPARAEREGLPVIDPVVMEAGDVEYVTGSKRIGIDDRIQLNPGFDDRRRS